MSFYVETQGKSIMKINPQVIKKIKESKKLLKKDIFKSIRAILEAIELGEKK